MANFVDERRRTSDPEHNSTAVDGSTAGDPDPYRPVDSDVPTVCEDR